MYKLFRNVLQECTDFSSLHCMRIFGLYLLMLYFEFFCTKAVFFFPGQMSILTMLIQNFIYSFPPLLMLHIKCIWAPLIFSFLHIRIILKRCVLKSVPRSYILWRDDALKPNCYWKIFYSFLFTLHACSLPLYLITNLFCEPCCYNFLNATKIVIESSHWNKRCCNSNIYSLQQIYHCNKNGTHKEKFGQI